LLSQHKKLKAGTAFQRDALERASRFNAAGNGKNIASIIR
jgi:hypothetical protein